MADVRINALSTTATSSSSDDFIAIDGSANGTRKLSAYSPTFGGNLTVSGTGTSSFANGALVKIGLPTNAPNTNLGGNLLQVKSAGGLAYITIGNGDVANATSYIGGASSYLLFGKVSDAGSLTEFARFVDSGNLLIGTTTDSNQKLAVVGVSSAPSLTASGTALASFTPSGVGTRLVFGGDPSSPFCTWMQNRHTGIDGLSYPIAINPSGGNVLVGTTTDGGQKLQVAGALAIQDYFRTTGSSSLPAAGGGNAFYAGGFSSPCSGKIIIGDGSGWSFNISKRTGSTTTDLFTFADSGALSVSNSITVTGGSFASLSNGSGQIYGNTSNGLTLYGAGSVYDLILLNKVGSIVMSIPTGTINAAFAGAIAIGNTVTTGVAVASTHKVQISIGGTTYYLLASNV